MGRRPVGDIHGIKDADKVPNHGVLLAGLPYQSFSIIGGRKGMADPRGTLFFDSARIIKAKQPQSLTASPHGKRHENKGGNV